ncbi:Ribosomal L7Ae/L30e/S12e/Gadd45 family protein [Giardia duodenalis assemblage B]|uniref:H/ACA ribonucleoprotein complex subunit 2 n=3 Tax=Giardia intestinalis TaxID=5741 RepID=A0A132NWU7_GIAIN|nr:Ribosomal protein L7Ae [Giardia intestinalis ATCC 50581]ESU43554.1 Ribosomal L7Ae/L30e/S12e/Gadd45 family protein [Giardia intestinalis]KWX14541.1 Ribosomal L7Ae/L30e/S12e/Gadd45 family protein [Giardia intestinalis assemblage B]
MPDARAVPLASEAQSKRIYELVDLAKNSRSISRGMNEVTKALNKGKARLVVLSADALPLELVLHLPEVCEDKGIAYIFVPSRQELGRSVGISRQAVAVAIKAPRQGTTLDDKLNIFLTELGH